MKRDTTKRDAHRRIIRRAHPACGICGEPIDYTLTYPHPKSYVVDHVTPLSRGGADTIDNKQAAHRDCNRAKGDKDFAPIIKRSGSLRHP